MFQIRYRLIADNFADLHEYSDYELETGYAGGIDGFIEIQFYSSTIGLYIDESTWPDAFGDEYVDYWIGSLLKVLLHICRSDCYTAFRQIETVKMWVECVRRGDAVFMREVEGNDTFPNGNFFVTADLSAETAGESIPFEEFRRTIIQTAEDFVRDVKKLAPRAEKMMELKSVVRKLHEVYRLAGGTDPLTP